MLIPNTAFSPVLLGVIEESHLQDKGKVQAKILFITSKNNKGWSFNKRAAERKINTATLNWHIAFDGRKYFIKMSRIAYYCFLAILFYKLNKIYKNEKQ